MDSNLQMLTVPAVAGYLSNSSQSNFANQLPHLAYTHKNDFVEITKDGINEKYVVCYYSSLKLLMTQHFPSHASPVPETPCLKSQWRLFQGGSNRTKNKPKQIMLETDEN
nr:hyp [Cotesia vestalis bracovirus]